MGNIINKSMPQAHRCIISTGSSSSAYVRSYTAGNVEESTFICNCLNNDDISRIEAANHYDVFINSSDEAVSEIIYDLFNFIIPKDVNIRVVFILDKSMAGSSMPKHVAFLEKLEKHKFITLEFIDDSPAEPVRPQDNIIYFVGPGNTGKTSIIASLSESFRHNNQKLALIDITRKNKLINYFPRHSFLNTSNLKDFSISRDFYRSVNIYTDGLVDLYIYDYDSDDKGPEIIYFCEILRKLSDLYDYIIVNADESSVTGTPYIYRTASKIFLVHDFMPTKIKTTKKLILKLIASGIETQKTVSLIYNKTLKDVIDIGKIEEKLLFLRLPNKKIIPTVDVNCCTFEIPYEQKTMAAIIKNLAASTNCIDNTSKTYRTNIQNIYKFINDIPYTDKDEMEISQFIKEKLKKLSDREYYMLGLNSIKAGMNNIKHSRFAAESTRLLQTGGAKLKRSSRLLPAGASALKLKLSKQYKSVCSAITNRKYTKINNKKQQ